MNITRFTAHSWSSAVLRHRWRVATDRLSSCCQLKNTCAIIKQLTFGGENAEAYFSSDGKQLIFQSTRDGRGCDQIYTMNVDGSNVKMISNGDGRTTCSYFYPGAKRILYSSTHLGDKQCPPKPDFSQGYVWAVYPSFDIFTAKPDGSDLKQLTNTPGYDAETTITLDGKKLVFTSMRDGDLDIYTMDADGKNVRRLTNELGYDGGPFWSYDGKQIVYRAHHPKTDEAESRLHESAETEPDSSDGARNLGDECRRFKQAPGDEQRQSQLRALLLSLTASE